MWFIFQVSCRSASVLSMKLSTIYLVWYFLLIINFTAGKESSRHAVTEKNDCRFMFEEPEGVVTSHRTFPFSNYDDNLDCSYVIRVGEGFRIRLAFIDFNTEKNMDYVTVHDGATWHDVTLLRLSGGFADMPARSSVVESTGPFLHIRFITDGSSARFGWRATYTIFPFEGCDGTADLLELNPNHYSPYRVLTDLSGTFSSPNLNGYTNGSPVRVAWLICQPTAARIVLSFQRYCLRRTNSFNVTVYDGSNTSSVPLGVLSAHGHDHPLSVQLEALSGSMLVVYESKTFPYDNSIINSIPSFTASYHSTSTIISDEKTTKSSMTMSTTKHIVGRSNSKIFHDIACAIPAVPESRVIESPGYPNSYENNLYVAWNLYAESGNDSRIQLNFVDFHTEGNKRDIVTIYDGPTVHNRVLLSASGSTIPDPIVTTGPQCLISFKTDGTVGLRGWKALYTSISSLTTSTTKTPRPRKGVKLESHATSIEGWAPTTLSYSNVTYVNSNCGGTIMANGVIQSPNYPGDYDSGRVCVWTISAPAGNADNKIQLIFTSFNTESCCDYVTVFDGPTSSSPIILSASGWNVPESVVTTGPHCLIRFKTDWAESGSGWQLIYKTGTHFHSIERLKPDPTSSFSPSLLPYFSLLFMILIISFIQRKRA